MLSISELNQFYGGSHILWDLDLHVPKGSCTCLIGRNGVGKTTLLRSLLGLVPVKTGKVLFAGQDIGGFSADRRARLGIGYVPQGREIFPQLTVEENLLVGLAAASDGRKDVPPLIFELFPVLDEMLSRRGGDLSGGQQQQLAIGRALVAGPQMLILDEPTEGIQPNIVEHIGDVIQKLNREQGLTVLLVEQKLPFARRVADRFTMMERGRVVASGEIEKLEHDLVETYLSV